MATKKVLSDAHIEIDVNLGFYSESKKRKGDIEGWANDLERAATDVKDFVRDHRSMDIHDVYVVRSYEFVCEHCKYTYDKEPMFPDCCEESIREWATQEQLIEFGYEERVNAA